MKVVGQAAAVAQLVGYVGRLIFEIKRAADSARQNERDCKFLVLYLSNIDERLRCLPQEREVENPLAQLSSTLEEARDMVIACQKRSSFDQFFWSRYYAKRFTEINARITADLSLFPFASYTAIARRLDEIIRHDSGTKAPAGSFSSGSVAVKTQKVVSHVSSGADNPRNLTWAEIAAATDNLAVVLGGGRLFPLRHNHIARLVGWCVKGERRMFVYEHMNNGTLRDHLLGVRCGGGSPVASSWKDRLQVLLGAARAIEHLHRRATPPVIHRNVSSSNILLDANWTSRLSDFGQALWLKPEGGQGQLVPEAIGTFGYLDPEYNLTRRVSPASDVYSFAVVMLEVLTGRPPVSCCSVTLVSSVLLMIQNGKLRDVLDGRPAPVRTPWELEALELVAHTAAHCLCPQGKDRPAMSNVVANLERALQIIRS